MSAITLAEGGLSAQQWGDALAAAEASPLQQAWGYGAAVRDLGASVSRIAIYDGDQQIGLAQLTHKRWLRCLTSSLCMRGPIWLGAPDLDIKTKAYAALRRRYRLGLWMPEAPEDAAALAAAGGVRVMTGYHTVMLDLTASTEQLRAQLDGKWRNRLSAGEANGLQIKRLTRLDDIKAVLSHESEQRMSKAYAALHPLLVPLYQFHGGEGAVLALQARVAHQPVAAIICLLHGSAATYHIGWANEQGKQLSALNLLLWSAMTQLKARGVRQFDLGGVNTDAAAGIARFKLGTGGQVRSLAGTFF